MKTILLITASILALAMSACKTTDISQDDLEKAKVFSQCAAGCYKTVYSADNPDLPTP